LWLCGVQDRQDLHHDSAGACASVAIVRDDGDHQRGEDRREECRRDLAEQQR